MNGTIRRVSVPTCEETRGVVRGVFFAKVLVLGLMAGFSAAVPGCGDDSSEPGPDAGIDAARIDDASTVRDGAMDSGLVDARVDGVLDASIESCHADPGPADKERFLVVSHPFDGQGQADVRYEMVSVDLEGALTFTGSEFEMGRSSDARIVFTPDGRVGAVPQEDGSIGLFAVDPDGAVTVVDAAYQGDFFASSLVMSPDGGRLYVLDSQWRENGGGIYAFRIGCSGDLTPEGLVAPAKLPYVMDFLDPEGTRAVVYARDVLDVQDGSDAHLLSLEGEPGVLASATAFTDDAIVSCSAVTHDGRYVLVGDNCGFCDADNRVGVLGVTETSIEPIEVLSPVEDPVSILASPFDDVVMVASGFGNAVYLLIYDPSNQTSPFTLSGELAYVGARPQLPARAVMLRRGTLTGRVFLAENLGVRAIVFRGNGLVEDEGVTSSGSGTDRIVGAIGLQP